jgi:hypothetical protein
MIAIIKACKAGAVIVTAGAPLLMGPEIFASEHWETRAQGISRRTGNSAVWTGREMIVWGGGSQSVWLGDGGRYDFESDTWRSISNSNAPSGRWFHGAVWTGTEMLVWGGRASFYAENMYNDGARYNPVDGTWTAMTLSGAPAPRSQFPTVWTGTEMLVWGGFGAGEVTLDSGGRYNPTTDSWQPISMTNAPGEAVEPTAVWTRHEMIVFGGIKATGGGASGWITVNTGGRYNPETDTWIPLPTENAPSITGHTAVWTGTDMIVWGGRELPSNEHFSSGARYNLAENRWYPISVSGAPSPRLYHASVWTGTEMIVWGGILVGPNPIFNDGARYNPASNVWSPMTQVNAPHRRMFWRPDLGIWTGRGLLFYGGSDYPQELDSTAYYIPPRTEGPPEISEQPRSVTAVEEESVSFSVRADGAEPFSYQWFFNSAAIEGATDRVLTLAHAHLSNVGVYAVAVSNAVGITMSSNATLRISNVPLISSIAPKYGSTGAVITITGKNFSPEISENLAYVGGAQALVTAATSESLSIVAPAASMYMPLFVSVNGLSASALERFSPTFPPRNLDASAFAYPQSLNTGDGPLASAMGDLDGDGRLDLVVVNSYSGTVSIYRTLPSTSGTNAIRFADALTWPAGVSPFEVVLADIDRDGKLDLVLPNLRGNTVTVRLNKSTPGNLVLSDASTFATGANPHQAVVGDIDRDGRPDILTANYDGGSISILRNATSPGGPAAFESPVEFQTGPGTHGVGVVDLDGDGKLDVVAAHHRSDSASTVVLRNRAQAGMIDATSLEVTAHLPGNGTYVAFGDLDGDGKMDVIVPSWYSRNVSIFRNVSTLGNLGNDAFGSPVILSAPGSVKRIAVADLDGDGRLDIAFPTEIESALSFYRNVGGVGEFDSSWFGPRVDLPAGWNGDGISVGDLDLDGMPDIAFCNAYDDNVWIYRGERLTLPTITRQPTNQAVALGAGAVISVEATGGRLQYQWFHDGVLLPDASGSALSFASVRASDAGEYFVIVHNSGGSETSQVATLTVLVERLLFLGDGPEVNEGDLISIPLNLSSQGEVGGIDFLLEFDPDYLAAPEIVWDRLEGALKQFSVPTPGQLQGVLALPATTIPGGTQTLALVQFRARTVLSNTTVDLNLRLLDVSDDAGDPFVNGSDAVGTSVGIANTGSLPGDNNGNQRLDVGDAALVMRLIGQLDPIRSWDLVGNDLNKNQRLDSGDVIKILRIVAEIDPPPPMQQFTASRLLASAAAQLSSELATLAPARLQANPGQLVTVQLRLTGLETSILGASLTLDYPTDALRLQSSQSHRVGSSVPGSAVAIWNVEPSQNNYATQNGHIDLAVSSSVAWTANDNILAEFTFEVQPGATNRYQWPISLSAVEVTGNGYNNRSLTTSGSAFIGRAPVSGSMANLGVLPSGTVSFSLMADVGADYRIDASDDLVHWSLLQEVLNHSGSTLIEDTDAARHPHRFYRSVPLP